MEYHLLDGCLRGHTAGLMGLADAASGYLTAVRRATSVLGISLDGARLDLELMSIEIALVDAPELLIRWTPSTGWIYTDGRSAPRYRVTSKSATSTVPDADNVAAWLGVLARGHRPGHRGAPQEPALENRALIDRLATFGNGRAAATTANVPHVAALANAAAGKPRTGRGYAR